MTYGFVDEKRANDRLNAKVRRVLKVPEATIDNWETIWNWLARDGMLLENQQGQRPTDYSDQNVINIVVLDCGSTNVFVYNFGGFRVIEDEDVGFWIVTPRATSEIIAAFQAE